MPEEYYLVLVIVEDNSATLKFQQIFSVKTAQIKSARKGSARSDTVSINQSTVKTVTALSA